jgi:hypothetical protein
MPNRELETRHNHTDNSGVSERHCLHVIRVVEVIR